MLDGLSFDPFSFQEDGFATSEVEVGGCEIFVALVVTPVVVMIDEAFDPIFEVAGHVVVFEQGTNRRGSRKFAEIASGQMPKIRQSSSISSSIAISDATAAG